MLYAERADGETASGAPGPDHRTGGAAARMTQKGGVRTSELRWRPLLELFSKASNTAWRKKKPEML